MLKNSALTVMSGLASSNFEMTSSYAVWVSPPSPHIMKLSSVGPLLEPPAHPLSAPTAVSATAAIAVCFSHFVMARPLVSIDRRSLLCGRSTLVAILHKVDGNASKWSPLPSISR
ncbi:hypothetical protein HR12_08740 [Microbacterium sp. SUBG005]|nr:hypothetical protein HR12_08740 [Microbacterium sp. SUBG005]